MRFTNITLTLFKTRLNSENLISQKVLTNMMPMRIKIVKNHIEIHLQRLKQSLFHKIFIWAHVNKFYLISFLRNISYF